MLLILQSTTRPQKPRSSALFHSGLLPVEPEEPDDPDEADDPDDETTDTRPDRIAAVPVGWQHSWSQHAGAAGGLSLEIAPMDRILWVDAGQRTVCVEPGCSLRELRRVLAAHGLTMASWPMLLDQTTGGATVGCGSHGSAPMDGTMADFLVGVRMVMRSGEVRDLSDDDAAAGAAGACASSASSDASAASAAAALESWSPSSSSPPVATLEAARVSLGLLGVAVRLTLRCIPCYHVRRHVHTLGVDEFVVWYGAGDTNVGAARIRVSVPAGVRVHE